MNAGILKEIIQLYQPVVTKTEHGASRTQWEIYYETHANVTYSGGNRSDEHNELVYNNSYRFIVRHYVPVKENMRIKYNGNDYKIISIEPNKYYNDKEIYCEKVNT